MAIKLKSRELPTVTFRRVLPDFLGPTDKDGKPVECFIEIDARAGGSVNPTYVQLVEKSMLSARVMMRKNSKVEDDEAFIENDRKASKAITMSRFAALYDACVIEWRSNIQTEDDSGKVTDIDCNRANFLELCEVSIPEVAAALVAFEKETLAAGEALKNDDEDTVKN